MRLPTRSTNKERHKEILKKDNSSTNGLPSCNNSLLQVQRCLQQKQVIISISPNCMHNFINAKLAKSLKILAKNVCTTHIDGEPAQVFKDLKITLGNYVLHSDFQARDLDNMDIVLGYPWMKSMGTININLEKKFLKLWYKKKKVRLQDISLSQLVAPNVVHDAVYIRTLEMIRLDALDDESMITYTLNDIVAKEYMNQDLHQTTEETPPESLVVEVKKKAPPVKIASYHHPHHPARQQSFRKECGHQNSYGPKGK